MNLDLSQTLELYTSYIQYHYYLSSVLGMSPSLFTFHYPLRCSDSNNAVSHNTISIGSANGGHKESVSVVYPTPVTPQLTAMCHASNKRKGVNMIYSEEIEHPLMALRFVFIVNYLLKAVRVDGSATLPSTVYFPQNIPLFAIFYSRVQAHLHAGVEISSNSGNNNHIQVFLFFVSCRFWVRSVMSLTSLFLFSPFDSKNIHISFMLIH